MATPFQIALSELNPHDTPSSLYEQAKEIAGSMAGTPMMSRSYYEKAFGEKGYIVPQMFPTLVYNAKKATGAFSKENLREGRANWRNR